MKTITTNNKTLAQLVAMAEEMGIKVTLNKFQPLARQRQAVIDSMREVGVRIDNTMAEKLA